MHVLKEENEATNSIIKKTTRFFIAYTITLTNKLSQAKARVITSNLLSYLCKVFINISTRQIFTKEDIFINTTKEKGTCRFS